MQNFRYIAVGDEFSDPVGGERWVKVSEDEAQMVSDPSVVEQFDPLDLTEN